MGARDQRPIVVTRPDLERLSVLIENARARRRWEEMHLLALADELESAEVVEPDCVPPDVVTMRSRVRVLDMVSGQAADLHDLLPHRGQLRGGPAVGPRPDRDRPPRLPGGRRRGVAGPRRGARAQDREAGAPARVRGAPAAGGRVVTPDRVVVSGIDGGLLDPVTKDYDPARPAIAALARLGVPLVLCSCRPRAEVALVSRLFGLGAPMIVENGAAADRARRPPAARRAGRPVGRRVARAPARASAGEAPGGAGRGGGGRPRPAPHRRGEPARAHRALPPRPGGGRRRPRPRGRGPRPAGGPRESGSSTSAGAPTRGSPCAPSSRSTSARAGCRGRSRSGRGRWTCPCSGRRTGRSCCPAPAAAWSRRSRPRCPRAERAPHGGPEGWNDAVLAVLTGRRLPTVSDGETGSGVPEADREPALAARG